MVRASVLTEVDEFEDDEDEVDEEDELPEDEDVELPEDLRPLRTPLAQREMAWLTVAVSAPRGPAMIPEDEEDEEPDDEEEEEEEEELVRELASDGGLPPPR